MGVPRQRLTKSRRNRRRANIFLESSNFIKCEKCGKEKKPHIVCLNCGFYKGREVVNVLEKLDKKEKKKKEKELKEAAEKKTEKEKK